MFYVYILTNKTNTVLYVGSTDSLARRIQEHKGGYSHFTSKYKVDKLVYFEEHIERYDALKREKTIKHWKREWKNNLIHFSNPNWKDLSFTLS